MTYEEFNNATEYLKLNAKLQQKKNAIRKELATKGILERGGYNTFDKYKYFSEAQYKLLFTELFSKHGVELKVDEEAVTGWAGTDKMPFGRTVKLKFTLIDTETGFFESSTISGEGSDKGDKAIYKAHTGALKYFLANTFMVATGDDAEADEPKKPEPKPEPKEPKKATPAQIKILKEAYTGENEKKVLDWAKVEKWEDLPMDVASGIIKRLEEKKNARTDS